MHKKEEKAMKHAKRSGWRPFWAALCAALLVLLPLVGGTVLIFCWFSKFICKVSDYP